MNKLRGFKENIKNNLIKFWIYSNFNSFQLNFIRFKFKFNLNFILISSYQSIYQSIQIFIGQNKIY